MDALAVRAAVALLATCAVMAVAIFVSAWTLDYWQAWLFLAVFAVTGGAITVYLLLDADVKSTTPSFRQLIYTRHYDQQIP